MLCGGSTICFFNKIYISHFHYIDSKFATLTSVEGDMMGYGGDYYASTSLKVMLEGDMLAMMGIHLLTHKHYKRPFTPK